MSSWVTTSVPVSASSPASNHSATAWRWIDRWVLTDCSPTAKASTGRPPAKRLIAAFTFETSDAPCRQQLLPEEPAADLVVGRGDELDVGGIEGLEAGGLTRVDDVRQPAEAVTADAGERRVLLRR